MERIIKNIIADIKSHKEVKASSLLQFEDWKRSQYVQLDEIISQNLSKSPLLDKSTKMEIGSTISHTTLRRIFENEISDSAFNDLRFLKTMEKLCIFLGFRNHEAYLLANSDQFKSNDENDDLKICKKIIEDCCKCEFEILQMMPNFKIDDLLKYTFKNSNYHILTKTYMEKLKKENFSFDFKYKNAGFKIISVETLVNSAHLKALRTKEHWDLIFNSPEKKFVNELYNRQIYYFKKDRKNDWKIWSVYNPNFANLI